MLTFPPIVALFHGSIQDQGVEVAVAVDIHFVTPSADCQMGL
jgi:hypothetical protein